MQKWNCPSSHIHHLNDSNKAERQKRSETSRRPGGSGSSHSRFIFPDEDFLPKLEAA